MSNDFYTHGSGVPSTGSANSSSVMRSEFDNIAAGFDKMLSPTGQANRLIKVNSGATAHAASIIQDNGTAVTVSGDFSATGINLATALKSATTSVSVSAATAPSSGQGLVATSSTTATWQNLAVAQAIVSKSSGYTVVAADKGKVFECQGTFTLSLTAAATLGADFYFTVFNRSSSGSEVVSVNPNGSEKLNGAPEDFRVMPGRSATFYCDGTRWYVTAETSVDYDYSGSATLNTTIGNAYATNATDCIVIGGRYTNYTTASASQTVAIGIGCVVSGANSVVLGTSATASGAKDISIGNSTNAAGTASIAIGWSSTALKDYSGAYGYEAFADMIGKVAYASGKFSLSGSAQEGKMVLRAHTEVNTPAVLTSDAAAAGQYNQYGLASNKAAVVTGSLIGKKDGSANIAAYTITATVVNNGGTLTVPTGTLTLVGSDSIGLDTAPTLTADNTNKALAVTSGSKTGTSIDWVCTLYGSEVI